MRDILFRGKCVSDGEWVEGDFFQPSGNGDARIRLKYRDCDKYPIYIVDRSTVGQFTGLEDKNGKRIFEGDILAGHSVGNLVVAWDEENARWIGCDSEEWFMCAADWFVHYEVVGNIHDGGLLLPGGGKS